MALQLRAVLVLLVLVTSIGPVRGAAPQAARIMGRVSDPSGRPVQNVRVTLQNDVYSPLASDYTDASGRFTFSASDGYFNVEIDPVGQPFERHRERFEIRTGPFARGGDVIHLDIKLVPARSAGNKPAAAGVRFAQQVPEPARKEYERGSRIMKDNANEGMAALRKAIELFPDYYDAMELLGTELVKAGTYAEAWPVLHHAVEVNPAGEGSQYALGVLYYRTGKHTDAVQALKAANALNAKSPNTALYLGLALLRSGDPVDAEIYLKRAYQMGATAVPDLHLALASIYIQAKRNRDAAAQLKLLLKEVPNLRDRDKIKGLIEKLEKGA
jgi:tetratricopeptide (TPR) repeat protein